MGEGGVAALALRHETSRQGLGGRLRGKAVEHWIRQGKIGVHSVFITQSVMCGASCNEDDFTIIGLEQYLK